MNFSSILDQEQSAFQFKSVFKYTRVPSEEEETRYGKSALTDISLGQKIARKSLVFALYSAFLISLPISVWFCIKRIRALERCVIFRLGQRLPLKGPGLVVTFPCVDVIDVIDLSPHRFEIGPSDQPVLTSDGSIIEIKNASVELAVSDAVRSFTQLRDSKSNIEKFVRLAFTNLITSTHLEDLERKKDWIMKDFVANCNGSINDWGWNITEFSIPSIVVISRAEPKNQLIDAIKAYFGPGGGENNVQAAQLPVESTTIGDSRSPQAQKTSNSDPFIESLRSMAGKFTFLRMLGFQSVTFSLEVAKFDTRYYLFHTTTGAIESIASCESPQVVIRFKSEFDFQQFLITRDTSLIEISHSLNI